MGEGEKYILMWSLNYICSSEESRLGYSLFRSLFPQSTDIIVDIFCRVHGGFRLQSQGFLLDPGSLDSGCLGPGRQCEAMRTMIVLYANTLVALVPPNLFLR